MLEELAFVLLWVVFFLIAFWAFLRFSPTVIKFFSSEIKEAKKNISSGSGSKKTSKARNKNGKRN